MAEWARLYLAHDGVALAQLTRHPLAALMRRPPRVLRTHWIAADQPGWTGVIAVLREQLATLPKQTAVELLLASTHLRLARLPFNPALADDAILREAAGAVIARQYRLDNAHALRIGVTPPRWQQASTVIALEVDKASELEHAVSDAGMGLISMGAAVVAVHDAIGSQEGHDTLCLVEGERCVVIASDSLRLVPFDPDAAETSLAMAQPSAARSTVWAPGVKLPDQKQRNILTPRLLANPPPTEAARLAWVLLNSSGPHSGSLHQPATRWPMMTALAVAGLVVAFQLNIALDQRDQLDTLNAALTDTSSLPGSPESGASPRHDPALDGIAQALQMPWGALLDALAAHAGPGITLRSVEPDATAGTAEVSGTAPDRGAFLAYVSALRDDRRLVSAMPIADEPGSAATGGLREFRLRVVWSASP